MNSVKFKLNNPFLIGIFFLCIGSPLFAVSIRAKLINPKKEIAEQNLSVLIFETKNLRKLMLKGM